MKNIQGYLETNPKDLLHHNHRGIVFVECWHVEAHQLQQSSHSGSLSDCNIVLFLQIPIPKSHPENENANNTLFVSNMTTIIECFSRINQSFQVVKTYTPYALRNFFLKVKPKVPKE